ncbi:helix-turn-helix transcriptional regulator [Helcobacillus sp. ACRRO]|uniref:helix-turn-helix domain-containing protein n=1 Tax=Helcobacillus sp. ACRRO TaxID=2918202 RepID=UPI001EF72EB5|nr:helix-turn-helix transcriptional regulator [Helcobacillus sp. ACRRO]MCG7427798.1 helix-turn-helix transcriptional regulator [Helcobacillus sp. ACRRO]
MQDPKSASPDSRPPFLNTGDEPLPSDLPSDPDFPTRFQAAVQRRNLSLHRMREHLKSHGVSVSASTLSMWRTGRTKPWRDQSLRALQALESILDTPPGYLTAAEQQVEKGSESWWASIRTRPEVLNHSEEYAQVRREVGLDGPPELRNAFMHCTVWYNENGQFMGARSTHIFQAVAARGERSLQATFPDAHGDRNPHRVNVRAGGRIGRQRVFEGSGQTVFELILDQPLERGQMAYVEYEMTPSRLDSPRSRPLYDVRTTNAIGQLGMELHFHPDCPPRRPKIRRHNMASQPEGTEFLDDSKDGALLLVTTDEFVANGGICMEWEWDG